MASGFPGSIDNFTDPLSNSPLTSPNHATLHADVNDAVEKIETYMGLVKVVPTSVSGTGASINSNNDVVVTSGGSNFTINGAFSSLYANYKVLIRGFRASAATDLFMSLGTSLTGTAHKFSGFYVSTGGTITGYGNTGATRFQLPTVGRSTTLDGHCEVTLFGPQIAAETGLTAFGVDQDNGALGRSLWGYHTGDTSFTALYFTTSSTETISNITVSIYGYR